MTDADIIVVGGGIAGLSAAAELAADASVVVLERESHPGYHATGRSAAYFAPSYGNPVVRGATVASEEFFRSPPAGFCEHPLLRPRDCMYVGTREQRHSIGELAREMPALKPITPEQARTLVPIFRTDYPACALADSGGGDIDVDALLQGYVRRFRERGSELLTSREVTSLSNRSGLWTVHCGDQQFTAPIVINAAGAWADVLAGMAGLPGIGLSPLRRTACLVDVPDDLDVGDWPLVVDADERFYFKPEAGVLLISPADETPSPPCDAQADELGVAQAVDRFLGVVDLEVRRVSHRWAGLRSFASDRSFVVGFDPAASGFFWLAGQGGYGVQSAPALAALTVHLVNGSALEGVFGAMPTLVDAMAPERLRTER